MKEIIIKLSDREAFAITHGGIGQPSKRKQFGAHGITTKISEQMIAQIGEPAVLAFKEEWKAIKSELPATTPKKVKPYPSLTKEGRAYLKKYGEVPITNGISAAPKRIEGYIVRE